VENKSKAVADLEAQIASLRSQGPSASTSPTGPTGPSAEELARAKAQITELERQLAAASAAPAPQMGKFDMDRMAEKLESDLAGKAKQLGEVVQKQAPADTIEEVSMKSITYPPEIVTPFSSAITYTITVAGGGRSLRLMFPVTADLGGSWKLPTPDEVQRAYKAARDQPQGAPIATGGGTVPVPPSTPGGSPGAAGAPRMTQRTDGVFVFDWGDGAAANPAPQPPQPGYTQTPPTPPPAPGGNTPPPPNRPAAPAPPAAPQPSAVPPPVMPVVGDRVIRFD
jgi:hypothetical protein